MQKIEISAKTIIFTVLFILLLQFLVVIKDLIFALFIAFIVASALRPFVIWLTERKIPRTVSLIIVYLLFVGALGSTVALIIPPLINELFLLAKTLPSIVRKLVPNNLGFININSIVQYVPNLTNQFITVVQGAFSNIVFLMSILFFSFYFLIEENTIKKILIKFFDENQSQKVNDIFGGAEKKLNSWFWGELVLMTVVGVLTFIGLSLIGLKYVIPLALLAGLLEVVPNLGPTIAAIPAVLIGFSQSYFLGIAALAVSFIVQQLENNVIVPVVMKKAVGVSPAITLIALIIGGKLTGVMGVLLAIPTMLFLEVVIMEMIRKPNIKKIQTTKDSI
ncbi:hypothetical protein AUK04_02020 [Candidatus Roizmanbacteria bacterium CG2_30_33_16]|uniref:AI-2E family transporter n=4 Tax=Candidatus Roizmaniibacteriota TaxID=1752723 RepID=A0A2M7E3U4_9BACT|nr:AI-2E family transporter [Candidatus Roizmanbacteria bacterium]OIP84741.1 MAG: hypothetical protein AUK04_02020 [Candidatus Roizmanbacteria bacterium CG2_30_33_16]PIP64780.1 MAG: hypothetical protein COW96_00625 [Candidatus Roizmanbacteria bacterium CG22_combo_CG10-13_8_21_14_all_33_16]PIV62397.1 MAG: hypothetical protein COS12_02605 [Candidatus Roizmanbacteria bacterium CG01_land_8_20_14_3_00_33_9]